jgi:hypothetical protein
MVAMLGKALRYLGLHVTGNDPYISSQCQSILDVHDKGLARAGPPPSC